MKKRDVITLTEGPLTLTIPAHAITQVFTAAALAHASNLQQAAANQGDVPALGAYWPGEGGHNAGLVRGENGERDYYLIIPGIEADASHTYGGYEHKTKGADSHNDGLANTLALLADGKDHPAAKFASGYTADGHTDFYLPARRELRIAEVNVPELFTKSCYWSSTQYSADIAFNMDFENGWQYGYDENDERLVRPVRRRFI